MSFDEMVIGNMKVKKGDKVRFISHKNSGRGILHNGMRPGSVYTVSRIDPPFINVQEFSGSLGQIGINYELLDDYNNDDDDELEFSTTPEPTPKRVDTDDIWDAIKQFSKGGH